LAAKKIRFFMCGEYGEDNGRPHYHYCLLNYDFSDRYHWRTSKRGDRLYRSSFLESIWTFGHAEIGEVTFESAAYVARYCTKKITGAAADSHYALPCPVVDESTGEIITHRKPEFTAMSLKPGIGQPFHERYSSDIYNHDYVVTRSGQKMRPPRFYDKKQEATNPEKFKKTLLLREERRPDFFENRDEFLRKQADNSTERLKVKEFVQLRTIQQALNRNFEKE